MALSAGGVKIAVDLILKAATKAFKAKDVKDAEAAVAQLIRDLMQKDPNLVQAAATIARAKAKSLTSSNVYLAEDMLKKVTSHKRTAKKAAKKAAKKPAKKAAKKSPAKKAARKAAKKSAG